MQSLHFLLFHMPTILLQSVLLWAKGMHQIAHLPAWLDILCWSQPDMHTHMPCTHSSLSTCCTVHKRMLAWPESGLLHSDPNHTDAHSTEISYSEKELEMEFNEKTGEAVLPRQRAQPDKHAEQQTVSRQPTRFILLSFYFPMLVLPHTASIPFFPQLWFFP